MLLSNSASELQFQPVAADGRYVNELTMFVQNRFFKGQEGYEVITPFQIKGDKKLLLIDRGWVIKPKNGHLPKLHDILAEQSLTGYIKLLNEYQFILGENILSEQKPLVMQKIDLEELSRITAQTFYPFILRLDPELENGFVREWVITSTLPERHLVYASVVCDGDRIVITYFCLVLNG